MVDTKVVLLGANGMLAKAILDQAPGSWDITGLDLPVFDISNRTQVLSELPARSPDIIVNCAAYTNVDGCETEEQLATAVNGNGPGYLAEAAYECGATLVHISTDYVFSGEEKEPYVEESVTAPASAYGRSKLAGEVAIETSDLEQYFILRTSWLYGLGGKNFVETVVRLGREREQLTIVDDQVGSPTAAFDLATAVMSLLGYGLNGDHGESGEYGLYHYANVGHCSWYGFAQRILKEYELTGGTIVARDVVPITTADYPLPAPRPAYSVLACDKYQEATGQSIPRWQESLSRYMKLRER